MSAEVRTYGNWRRPRSAGLYGLPASLTYGLLGVLIAAVVVQAVAGVVRALAVLAVGGAVIALMAMSDVHGVSMWAKLRERTVFMWSRNRGRTLYRSGPVGAVPGGRCFLPGLLADSTVSEHEDSYQRAFALVRHRAGAVSVVLGVDSGGVDLVDPDQVDAQVALWGAWLANLGSELGIAQASVVVETVPDTGARLERQVSAQTRPDAPPTARRVMEDVVGAYKRGAAQVRCHVALTFQPPRMGVRRKDADQVARDIGSRLPYITQSLKGACGGGAVRLLTCAGLARAVRTAYDPASEALFEEAALRGERVDLEWEEAGPIGAQADWDSYRHDSGVSRTWVVTAPPSGVVQSGVLAPLLGVSRDVERKRVALLYRPIEAGATGALVERDLKQAQARVSLSKRPTARETREMAVALRNAQEEASGAGLVDFAALVTATASSAEDLEEAGAAVRSLAAASKLRVRPAYGAQDAAFALALPVGALVEWQAIRGIYQ